MRALTWNVRRASVSSRCWALLLELDPDVVVLQEVGAMPASVLNRYACVEAFPAGPRGVPQRFKTAILAKGIIGEVIDLASDLAWINAERALLEGNIVARQVLFGGSAALNVVSVYSPAWPIARERLASIDVTGVKLQNNPDVWCTEILWSVLKHTLPHQAGEWIVGGDFNSSETFDLWKKGGRGNREIIDRMNALGLVDCLRTHHGQLVPTFRNPRGGKVAHQMDHLYVSHDLLAKLVECHAFGAERVFGQGLSDHLPIVAEFRL